MLLLTFVVHILMHVVALHVVCGMHTTLFPTLQNHNKVPSRVLSSSYVFARRIPASRPFDQSTHEQMLNFEQFDVFTCLHLSYNATRKSFSKLYVLK